MKLRFVSIYVLLLMVMTCGFTYGFTALIFYFERDFVVNQLAYGGAGITSLLLLTSISMNNRDIKLDGKPSFFRRFIKQAIMSFAGIISFIGYFLLITELGYEIGESEKGINDFLHYPLLINVIWCISYIMIIEGFKNLSKKIVTEYFKVSF